MEELATETQTRWDRRKEQTHRRLLNAAERLFRTQGFDATTVEEIAGAADVAKGTFFNYFSSKETMLGELLYLRTQPLLTALPGAGSTAPERIWALLNAVRRELGPYVHLFQRMFAYALAKPLPMTPPEGHLSLAHALAQLVRDGQETHVFRADCDAEVAAVLISTYFFRLCVMDCSTENVPGFCWEDQMRAALNVLYLGLTPPGEDVPAG